MAIVAPTSIASTDPAALRLQAATRPYLEDWQTRTWPILGETLQALRAARTQTSVSPASLAQIVSRDPLLAFQVLCYVNGVPRGRVASEVASLAHAIMLLGMTQFFERFSRRPAIEVQFAQDPARLQAILDRIQLAQLSAEVVHYVARQRLDSKIEEVTLAALLHDIVDLFLLISHPQPPNPMASPCASLLLWQSPEVQTAQFGVCYGDLLRAMPGAFKVPQLLLELMADQQLDQPRGLMVQACVALVRHLQFGWWDAQIARSIDAIAQLGAHHPATVWRDICRIMIEFTRHHAAAAWFSPAMSLPLVPGDWPMPKEKPVPKALAPGLSAALPPVAQTAAAASPTPAAASAMGLQVDLQALRPVIAQLKQARADHLNVGQVMALLFKGLQAGLGLTHVAFWTQSADGTVLQPRFAVGFAPSGNLARTAWPLGRSDLFGRIMASSQSVCVCAKNRVTIQPLLPTGLGLGAEQDFVLRAIWVNNRPLGLVYGDAGAMAIPEPIFNAFKQLTEMAQVALTEAAAASAGK